MMLLSGLAACQTAPAVGPDRLTRFFAELSFGNAAEPEGTSASLVRWPQPSLVYSLDGEREASDDARVTGALRRFQSLTGLEIVRGGSDTAQLTIEFTKEPLGPVHDELTPCLTRVMWRAGQITRARIIVNTEKPGTLALCLDHELMHSFGFRHHSAIAPSVMSPFQTNHELSAADAAALQTLYGRRLTGGMSAEQALPLARAAFVEMLTAPGAQATFAAPQSASTFEWHAIPEADMALIFAPASLERNAVSHHYRATAPNESFSMEVLISTASDALRPRALLFYITFLQAPRAVAAPTLDDIATRWFGFADRSVALSAQATHDNQLGTVRYVRSETDQGPCIVFIEEVWPGWGGRRDISKIQGYYCAATGVALGDIESGAILDTLDLRAPGHRSPVARAP